MMVVYCNLVVILMYVWEVSSTAFTYTTILLGTPALIIENSLCHNSVGVYTYGFLYSRQKDKCDPRKINSLTNGK